MQRSPITKRKTRERGIIASGHRKGQKLWVVGSLFEWMVLSCFVFIVGNKVCIFIFIIFTRFDLLTLHLFPPFSSIPFYYFTFNSSIPFFCSCHIIPTHLHTCHWRETGRGVVVEPWSRGGGGGGCGGGNMK